MTKPHVRKRVICAAAAVLLTGLSSTVFVSAEPRAPESRAVAKPVRDARVDRAQIDRGRYLVKTAGCNDCHTPGYGLSGGAVEESKWLVGDSLGWEGPWGTTYAANLRLFMQNLTVEQWVQIAGARRARRCPGSHSGT